MEKSTHRFSNKQVQRVFDNAVKQITGNNNASIIGWSNQIVAAAKEYANLDLNPNTVFSMLVQAVKH